ncbi:MAG: isocitrate lyase/phosphoenolpyruvate mutase family protein [Ilumatobacter sp.]|nr:isocitrate lyase/phosphoenolpyruvate mutase family protein [Ilumatobacter sp.]
MTRAADLRTRFLALHLTPPDEPTPGILVMPNAFDIGSAKLIVTTGALAVATTSSGHAATLGRPDQHVTRPELVEHAAALSAAVDVPLSVDSEDCLADDLGGVEHTAALLAATDAAGFSIEDYDPRAAAIRSVGDAAERVAAAKHGGGDLVLTARAENHLHGVVDLDDTIARLIAYRDAGADVVYAPGLADLADISRLVDEVDCPVNVLARPDSPTVAQLAAAGVARISVGGMFTWAAYGAVARAAEELLSAGTSTYVDGVLPGTVRSTAFS